MREMRRYHLDKLGITECRWTGSGKIRTQTGETIIYSERLDDHHSNGVATAMTKEAAMSLDEWMTVGGRITTTLFWSRDIETTIVQVYAPTNDADEECKDSFYEHFLKVINSTTRHDPLLLICDLNAEVWNQLDGENSIVGVHCERNDHGERFTAFCAINNFAITFTMFPHKYSVPARK